MKAKSVVVLGPSLGQYPEMVAKGFRQNGLEAESFCYIDSSANLLQRLIWGSVPLVSLDFLHRIAMEQLLFRVRKACEDAALLVIIRGDEIPIDIYSDLIDGVKCPKVLWLMDSVHNVDEGLKRAGLADMVLSFEGTDSPALSSLSVPHQIVALAVDPDRYFPTKDSFPRWDLSFVGSLYSNRLAMLDSILSGLESSREIRAQIAGDYRSELHPFRSRHLVRSYPFVAPHLRQAGRWPHERINRLNNESLICLNVFHPQSVDSVNMRFFEIGGSGAFQLCQSNFGVSKYLDVGREIEVFETPLEAAEKAFYYLRNQDTARRIGAAGRRRVLAEHTYKARIKQIIQTLKKNRVL